MTDQGSTLLSNEDTWSVFLWEHCRRLYITQLHKHWNYAVFTRVYRNHCVWIVYFYFAKWEHLCVCVCVLIDATDQTAGIILSNLLSAGLRISRMLGAFLSSLFSSSLCATQMFHTIHPHWVHHDLLVKPTVSESDSLYWLPYTPLSCMSILCVPSFLYSAKKRKKKLLTKSQ